MKQFLLLILVGSILSLTSCAPQQPYSYQQQQQVQPDYQVMTSPAGQQMVMYNDGGVQRMLDYALFMSLFNNGGYSHVHNYYVGHPSYFHPYSSSAYGGYRTQVVHVNHYHYNTTTPSNSYKTSNGISVTKNSSPSPNYSNSYKTSRGISITKNYSSPRTFTTSRGISISRRR